MWLVAKAESQPSNQIQWKYGVPVPLTEKHAKKGRLVYVAGKLQTRKWRKEGEDSDRYSTEIILVPGSRIQFLERPATHNGSGAKAPNGEAAAPVAAANTDALDSGTVPF